MAAGAKTLARLLSFVLIGAMSQHGTILRRPYFSLTTQIIGAFDSWEPSSADIVWLLGSNYEA
jgi:hypothetical protein